LRPALLLFETLQHDVAPFAGRHDIERTLTGAANAGSAFVFLSDFLVSVPLT
jgi:hypothetical protein